MDFWNKIQYKPRFYELVNEFRTICEPVCTDTYLSLIRAIGPVFEQKFPFARNAFVINESEETRKAYAWWLRELKRWGYE